MHGGQVERIRDERYSEVYALLGALPDARDVVESYAGFHQKWAERAHCHGVTIAEELDAILGDLNASVDWDAVRTTATAK